MSDEVIIPSYQHRSQEIGKLALALSQVQGKLEHAKRDVENPFFKSRYADLAAVLDVAKELLTEHELCVSQTTFLDDGKLYLRTELIHSSGQWQASIYPIVPVKHDPQSLGSALTYARRYQYQAIVGIATEDDDGNAAAEQPKGQTVDRGAEYNQTPDWARERPGTQSALTPEGKAKPASDKQINFLKGLLRKHDFPSGCAEVLVQLITGSPEMSAQSVSRGIKALEGDTLHPKIADLRDEYKAADAEAGK